MKILFYKLNKKFLRTVEFSITKYFMAPNQKLSKSLFFLQLSFKSTPHYLLYFLLVQSLVFFSRHSFVLSKFNQSCWSPFFQTLPLEYFEWTEESGSLWEVKCWSVFHMAYLNKNAARYSAGFLQVLQHPHYSSFMGSILCLPVSMHDLS